MLGHQSLKAHAARRPQQVKPDLAAFKRMDEDTLRAPCKQALDQDVEGAKLDLIVMLAGATANNIEPSCFAST